MKGSTRRRVAWGLLDQVLASGSNFLVTIIAARSLSATDFGAFALAMAVAIVSIFLARGLASDPLATSHASDEGEQMRWAARAGASTALLVALGVAATTALVGALVGGRLGLMLVVLAVLLPGLTLQDYLRYVLIVKGRADQTFFNDLFWFLIQLPLLLVAIGLDGDATLLLLAWGGAGNLAALLGLYQARTGIGGPSTARAWLRRHRSLWPFFVLDNLVYQATTVVLVVVISLIANLAEVGGFRAAMTIYAPLAIIGRGIVGVAVPELARRRGDPRAVARVSLVLGWVLVPVSLAYAGMTLLLPDSWGRALLGESWELAAPLLLLAGVTNAVSMFTVGTVVGIRALAAGRDGLTARVVVSVLALAVATVGAVLDGAYGAMLALALSSPLQIATWWWLLVRASRRAVPVGPGEVGPGEVGPGEVGPGEVNPGDAPAPRQDAPGRP
ncbi:hypothetical protein [Nocardioides sp.]|uniref:hypothetical protein n=1 Tax=Nocardioides sp. TaxID=35761 RepID=UPI0027341891|nr:hypothetical protein [Nocardioides sp.]MDP3894578.1 hypothetical protein [Nocardioides sp.]